MLCSFIPDFKPFVKLFVVASVEAPLAFLKKPEEVFFFNTIEFAKMSLCLIPKILNAVDMIFLVGEQLRVVNSHVVKIRHIKCVIGAKRVCINNTIWFHFLLNKRQKSVAFCIGNNY